MIHLFWKDDIWKKSKAQILPVVTETHLLKANGEADPSGDKNWVDENIDGFYRESEKLI